MKHPNAKDWLQDEAVRGLTHDVNVDVVQAPTGDDEPLDADIEHHGVKYVVVGITLQVIKVTNGD